MPETLKAIIQRDRERLMKAREDALARKKQIDDELQAIEQEFEAIKAYERIKAQKTQKGGAAPKKPGQRARRGERQQEVLDLIGQHPDGLTRSEILERLGVKGDKKAEASISNALNNLKRTDDSDPEERATYCLNEQPTTERGSISRIAQFW